MCWQARVLAHADFEVCRESSHFLVPEIRAVLNYFQKSMRCSGKNRGKMVAHVDHLCAGWQFARAEAPMVRWYRPDLVHEVTMVTIDRRWWFEAHNIPMRKEIIGALAMAQRETGVRVHGFTFMSNHYHGLFSADFPEQFSTFLCHFHAALARIANRRWDRTGKVWDGRATVIPIFPNEESQLQRLEYLLLQNVKAGAGAHPRDWIGASSTPWLLDGTPLVGTHRDQTAIALASRNGHDPGDLAAYTDELTVEMTPLPCFAGVPDEQWRAQVREIADGIAAQYGAVPGPTAAVDAEQLAAATHMTSGRFEDVPSDLGESAERVRTSAAPESKPIKPVHAARRADLEELLAERKAFEQEYREAVHRLRAAAAQLAAGLPAAMVEFPKWGFPARAPAWPRWPGMSENVSNFEQ